MYVAIWLCCDAKQFANIDWWSTSFGSGYYLAWWGVIHAQDAPSIYSVPYLVPLPLQKQEGGV